MGRPDLQQHFAVYRKEQPLSHKVQCIVKDTLATFLAYVVLSRDPRLKL